MIEKVNSQKGKAMVFIDGSNLYHNLKASGTNPSEIDFDKLRKFVCSHFDLKHKHTFYYNSVPDIRDGQVTYYKHMEFLSRLEKFPDFDVKIRKLQKNSNAERLKEKKEILSDLDLCDTCKPIVETNCYDCIGKFKKKEKGIDVLLAVDMIGCAVDNKFDACVLVSGDADFIPALDMITRRKKKVFTACPPKGYSSALRSKFDYLVLGRDVLSNECFKDSYK